MNKKFVSLFLVLAMLVSCGQSTTSDVHLSEGELQYSEPLGESIDSLNALEPESETITPEFQFEVVGEFVDGVARIRTGRYFRLIDADGNVLVKPIYTSISEFVDGVAKVNTGGRSYGLIDIEGNILIEPIYRSISEFVDGFAVVRENDKFGLISIDGSWVIEPMYDNLILQAGGVAVFGVEGGRRSEPLEIQGIQEGHHLHYEVRISGAHVNPRPYYPTEVVEAF